MTWTYSGSPGVTTASQRKDTVRLLIGDVDSEDPQLQDEEISFCLGQTANDVYMAGSMCALNIAARYGRLVDSWIDDSNVRMNYSQRQKNYLDLAKRLERQSSRFGSKSLGIPDAGGISVSAVSDARADSDRVQSMFAVSAPSEVNTDEGA